MDEVSNIEEKINALINDFKNKSKLNGELLLKILFDFIKRRVDFNELLREINKIDNHLT